MKLEQDLAALRKLAFKRYDQSHERLRAFHRLAKRIETNPMRRQIWNIYDWLLVPFSLWPIDLLGLSDFLLNAFKKRQALDAPMNLLLELLPEAPKQKAVQEVLEFEEKVIQKGNYEPLIKEPAKFRELEANILADPNFDSAWKMIKKHFDVTQFQNSQGIYRRRMVKERNFRDHWDFSWDEEKARFKLLFDALCYRWQLFGMKGDFPLVLKLTINPTPHGTLIMIPGNWSLDNKRDLNWSAIRRIHQVHGSISQGPKLSQARIEALTEAKYVTQLWDEAGNSGLKGDARIQHVLKKMGKDPRTDPSWVKRRLKQAKAGITSGVQSRTAKGQRIINKPRLPQRSKKTASL